MNRIEYIRYSHRRANSRVRAWIGSVRMRLVRRSRLLGWIWMVPASIFYALVVLFSWLTFCVVLFRDPRFTLHYLESEIECRGLSGAEARRYLDEQHRDYERRLAYGNFTRDEQRRIDQTFAYLYNRYPAPVRDDLNARLDEVQSAVAEIAGFTRQRQEELEQARERETALQAQAEKRRAINRSRTGFDPTPEDFSPRLTDRQLDLLTEHINRIGLFRRDVTRPEVELLLACQLPEPLQTTHNKLLALLLESLSAARFITPKWQRVAGAKGCSSSRSWASRLQPRISRRPSRWPTSSTRNASSRFSTASGPWRPRNHSLPVDARQQARAKSLCRVPSSCLQGASTREKDGKDCPNKRKHWQTMSSAFFLRFFVSVITSPCVVQRLCQTF